MIRHRCGLCLALFVIFVFHYCGINQAWAIDQIGPDILYNPLKTKGLRNDDIPPLIKDSIEFAMGKDRSISVDPRIIGGTLAPIGAYPWQVSIGVRGISNAVGHFCGGSIIAPHWIVTAAHCVYGLTTPDNIQILIGTNYLNNGGRVVYINTIFVFDDWSPSTFNDDIALLRTTSEMSETPIRIVDDAHAEAPAPAGVIGTVSGWGLTRNGGKVSPILRNVGVQIVTKDDCTSPAAYGDSITKSMFCAGFVEGGKDSCQGDSGGPFMVPDGKGRLLLAGIVSWGEGCGQPGKYGVYTSVPKFSKWLRKKTGIGAIAK